LTLNDLGKMLLGSLAINYILLSIGFTAFDFGHDILYQPHSRWFRLSVATFAAVHYAGMAPYKIGMCRLNVAPLIALLAIGS